MIDKELVYDGVDHQAYPVVEGIFLSELEPELEPELEKLALELI